MKIKTNEAAQTRDLALKTIRMEAQGFQPTFRRVGNVDYQVFPVVMLVEGVHQGVGSAPVYYPPSTLEASAALWNNVPVTIGHPVSTDGEHILVNHDGTIVQQWSVGHVSNVRADNGKLRAEIWLNQARVQQVAPGLLDFLQNGGQLEVSTGLLALEDGQAGTWQNEEYTSTVQEILPDHLALLPGSTGACSWSDGCGVRWNVRKEPHLIIHSVDLQGVVEKVRQTVDSMDEYDAQSEQWTRMNFVRAVYDDYFIYMERSRTGNSISEKMVRQGYSLDTNGQIVLEGDPEEVVEEITYKRKSNEEQAGADCTTNNTKEEKHMKRKANEECCEQRVSALIANENSPFTEEDREWLSSMNEAQIEKLETNSEPEVEDPGEEQQTPDEPTPEQVTLESFLAGAPAPIRSVLNEGLRQLDAKRKDLIKRITGNERNRFTAQQLEGMDTAMLENMAEFIVEEAPVQQPSFDFSGRVPGAIQVNQEEDEEPYVPQTLSGVLGAKK